MKKNRIEAFSDGVIAILITIMVLELKVPHDVSLDGLQALWPVFLSYVLSFIFLGIYWNNHHHLFHAAQGIHGSVLWPNLHLLFWLSLIPFVTAWMGENYFATVPVAAYGFVLLMCGLSYYFLSLRLKKSQDQDSALVKAIGRDRKGQISVAIYTVAIPLSFFSRWIALALYVVVAVIWFCPDQRIEKTLNHHKE